MPTAGQTLVGKVDAVFVPNGTTVYAVFESLVKVAGCPCRIVCFLDAGESVEAMGDAATAILPPR